MMRSHKYSISPAMALTLECLLMGVRMLLQIAQQFTLIIEGWLT